MRRIVATVPFWALLLLAAPPAAADEVIFLNGDRLTGKIVSAAGGKLVIKTDAAGEVIIDMAKVKTFSTDAPVQVKVGDKPPVSTPVTAGPDGQVQIAPGGTATTQTLPISQVAAINPPAPEWKGSLALTGLLTRGNSETEQLGFRFGIGKRWEDDRFTAGAEYTYGRQRDPDTDERTTTVDYGAIFAKWDHFFTKKFYGYLSAKAEQDGVADLEYRFTPSVGAGYQWFETPTFNLSNEVGLAYVYEKYERQNATDFLGPRLAYHVDWTPVGPLKLFHNLEYLPSFEDFAGDYLLNLDAGLRVTVWKGFFTDFRFEYRYDSTPASGRKKDDTRFVLAVGWEF